MNFKATDPTIDIHEILLQSFFIIKLLMTCFIRKTNTPTTTILHINTLHLSIILSQKHIKGLSIHAVQLGKRKYRFLTHYILQQC